MLDQVTASEIKSTMLDMGKRARKAATKLAIADAETKNAALHAMAARLGAKRADILAANEKDMKAARGNGTSSAFLDRLQLNDERIDEMMKSLGDVASLEDPVGTSLAKWARPNGLEIERVRTPLGVVGVIFESRPNVTVDAGALCLKSGNAVILRGGSDSYFTSRAVHVAMFEGLEEAGLSGDCVQIVPTKDREAVGEMLRGLNGTIDVIVPRGGRSLVERVQDEARVPVFAHLEGLCHIYIDASADLEMAQNIVFNAKLRRTGICGAAETLLIDRKTAETFTSSILEKLHAQGCEIRADETVRSLYSQAVAATEEDWATEYLDAIISVKLVDGIEEAIEHIQRFSSNHTEAVIAEDPAVVEKFFNQIDSAILMHNASTQFADGGEFGMGAEIGIATGKMHARGPVGVEQLTSFKYLVRGNGQVRP